jgi:hypothetical protein
MSTGEPWTSIASQKRCDLENAGPPRVHPWCGSFDHSKALEWKRHWIRYVKKLSPVQLAHYHYANQEDAVREIQEYFGSIPDEDGNIEEESVSIEWPPAFMTWKPSAPSSSAPTPSSSTVQVPEFVQVTSTDGVTQKNLKDGVAGMTHIPLELVEDRYYLVDSGEGTRINVCRIEKASEDARGHLFTVPEAVPEDECTEVTIQWLYRCKQDLKKPLWESRWLPLANKNKLHESIEQWSTLEIGPEVKLSNAKGGGKGYVLTKSIPVFKRVYNEITKE